MGGTLISSCLAAVCLWTMLSLAASAGLPCDSNPCERGLCKNNGSTSYYCECPAGYSGVNCQHHNGLCINAPCTSLDPHASCSESDPGYECSCSADDVYGLNCESKIQQPSCAEENPESYCLCNVNGLPVKVPLHEAMIRSGLGIWDFIWGIIGLLIGWLLGTALLVLYRYCWLHTILRRRRVDSVRPDSASSNQSQMTTLSSNETKSSPVAASASPPPVRDSFDKKPTSTMPVVGW